MCALWHALRKELLLKFNPEPAELLATYHRAAADAAHKYSLIQTVARKGPKAIQAAVDTAAKAAKRRDSYAAKLQALGVQVDDAAVPAGEA